MAAAPEAALIAAAGEGGEANAEAPADGEAGAAQGEPEEPERELVPVVADGKLAPTWVDLDRVLIVGGFGQGERACRHVEVMDTTRMAYEPGPDMLKKRWGCAVLWLNADQMLILGGYNGKRYLNTTEVLDVKTMTFTPGPRMRERRSGFAVVRIDARRFLIIGGYGTDTSEVLLLPPVEDPKEIAKKAKEEKARRKKGEIIEEKPPEDPEMKFLIGPQLKLGPRACCAAVMLDGRRLLVAGGFDRVGCTATTELFDIDTCIREDPDAPIEELELHDGRFVAGPSLPSPRAAFPAVKLDERRVIFPGGFDGAERLASTEMFDIRTYEFSPGPSLTKPRSGCAALLISDSQLVVFGGCGVRPPPVEEDEEGEQGEEGDEGKKEEEAADEKEPEKPAAKPVDFAALAAAAGLDISGLQAAGVADAEEEGDPDECDDAIGGDGSRCLRSTEMLSFNPGDPEEDASWEFVASAPMILPRGYLAAAAWVSPEVEEADAESGEDKESGPEPDIETPPDLPSDVED
eukprot:TRINITY_DN31234_c0_g1_i1.p1 TRINITY_DN31234_c0_g1~~TRINITY_DN31234_c0_g1_i1.p1  ORF type:complete len:519 (+),score=151.53 TRINITY_DN31234_c0_g1_i1:126-1682(+)